MTSPADTSAPPQLDQAQVLHVAKLARLKLEPADVARYSQQLSSILDYVAQLKSVNVEGVHPMSHPLPLQNVLRDDTPRPALTTEQVLANAPKKDGPYFAVPKVLDTAMGGG